MRARARRVTREFGSIDGETREEGYVLEKKGAGRRCRWEQQAKGQWVHEERDHGRKRGALLRLVVRCAVVCGCGCGRDERCVPRAGLGLPLRVVPLAVRPMLWNRDVVLVR